MTQEVMNDHAQIAVKTTVQEDCGDLIPDFAIQQMAKFFLAQMQAEAEEE